MYKAQLQVMGLVVDKLAVRKPAVAHIAMPVMAVAIAVAAVAVVAVVAADTGPVVDLHSCCSRHIHQQAHHQTPIHAFW